MIELAPGVAVAEHEIEFHAIRAGGPGGQNVNKVSNAVHLRFDIVASSLPAELQERLCALHDHRISEDGVIVIKAQRFRSLRLNHDDALARLRELVSRALLRHAPRIETRPAAGVRRRRLDAKTRRGRIKAARARVRPEE